MTFILRNLSYMCNALTLKIHPTPEVIVEKVKEEEKTVNDTSVSLLQSVSK